MTKRKWQSESVRSNDEERFSTKCCKSRASVGLFSKPLFTSRYENEGVPIEPEKVTLLSREGWKLDDDSESMIGLGDGMWPVIVEEFPGEAKSPNVGKDTAGDRPSYRGLNSKNDDTSLPNW